MHTMWLPLALAALMLSPSYAQTGSAERSALPALQAPVAEPTGSLSLRTALELAYRANPDIAAARREAEAWEGTVLQAGTIRNPELAALMEDVRRDTRTTTVQLNQPIELGGKRSARVNAAERGRDAALAELASRQADLRATVISAFYDVVIAQERYRLSQATAELARRATEAASKRVLAGKVSPVEETRARVAESGVRVELAQATNELEAARRRLAATWGTSVPRFKQVDAQWDALPSYPALPELVQRLQQSPALARARIEVDRRQALAQVERANQVPDVTISLGAKRDEQLGRNQAVVGISVPIPLFNRNQGNVLEANRRLDKARDELTAAEVRLNNELAQSYSRFHTARQETQLLREEILPGAQSAYDAASKGFELGKFSFLEVLDAQRTFFQARAQHLRALAEAHRASAEIDRIVGVPFDMSSTEFKHQEKQ